MQSERTITREVGILEGVQAHQDRAPHGGPLDGSAYPRTRHSGRVVSRLFPSPGLLHVPVAHRRLDCLPRPSHHQRGLASHRLGRQTSSRYGLRRVPLRGLGVGRLGDHPGHTDPHSSGPRRGRLGRRRRHPLPQTRGQGRLRRDLPRRGPLLGAAQDLPVRPELGRAGDRRADPDACRPLLLPAGALAALPQEGATRAQAAPPIRRRTGSEVGRGQPQSDLLAGRRQCLRQRRVVAGPAGQSPGDRPASLEGRLVRPSRPACQGSAGPPTQEGAAAADPQGDDRGHDDVSRRVDRDRLPAVDPAVAECR